MSEWHSAYEAERSAMLGNTPLESEKHISWWERVTAKWRVGRTFNWLVRCEYLRSGKFDAILSPVHELIFMKMVLEWTRSPELWVIKEGEARHTPSGVCFDYRNDADWFHVERPHKILLHNRTQMKMHAAIHSILRRETEIRRGDIGKQFLISLEHST